MKLRENPPVNIGKHPIIIGIIQDLSTPPLRQRGENKKQMSNNLKIGD